MISLVPVLALAMAQGGGAEQGHNGGGSKSAEFLPAGEVKWNDAPAGLPEGAQIALIHGDPGREGEPYTLRLKFPAGYRVAPHWHPQDEHVTVLSGTAHFGTGTKFDKSRTRELPPGSYFFVTGRHPHFVWNEEPVVLQLHGRGPFDIEYVNPADDPRKGSR